MTLHRRPDEAGSSATPQYYRTSLTLPTSTRQRSRYFFLFELKLKIRKSIPINIYCIQNYEYFQELLRVEKF